MNKQICTLIFWSLFIFIVASLAVLLPAMFNHPPLICKIYTWDHPEGKIVKCAKVGSDVSGNYAPEPEATATEYIYPTLEPTYGPYATPTFTPRATRTPTRTTTIEPYPPQETEIQPYP